MLCYSNVKLSLLKNLFVIEVDSLPLSLGTLPQLQGQGSPMLCFTRSQCQEALVFKERLMCFSGSTERINYSLSSVWSSIKEESLQTDLGSFQDYVRQIRSYGGQILQTYWIALDAFPVLKSNPSKQFPRALLSWFICSDHSGSGISFGVTERQLKMAVRKTDPEDELSISWTASESVSAPGAKVSTLSRKAVTGSMEDCMQLTVIWPLGSKIILSTCIL